MVAPCFSTRITMKSTTSPAPAPTTEYTHSLGNGMSHIWNIRSSASAAPSAVTTAISDLYLHENMSSTDNRQPGHTQINKSFPRHRELVCASLGSASQLIARDIEADATGGGVVCRKRYITAAATATARAHDTRHVTPFTHLSVYQKHHLVSMSGLAGLLVARWTGVRGSKYDTIKYTKKHAELTVKYIHSALACEFLIGNRYYRDLPRIIASLNDQDIGSGGFRNIIIGNYRSNSMGNLTPDDITPKNMAFTKIELLETYAAQIDRLLHAVREYKRGFVGLEAIRTDPEFTRLMCAFWRYCNQTMKVKNEFESRGYDYDEDDIDPYNTRRIFVVADVCSVGAMVPQLYNYDIVHLFDNAIQSFAKFVKTARNTLVRLSNDGLTMAFLSFAAIEPRMVTSEMAPKRGMRYLTTSLTSCANHIPSRHPLFGELRVKHRENIPRTADAFAAIEFRRDHPRTRNIRVYSPLYDTVENFRTGRCQEAAPVITSAAKGYAAHQAAAVAAAAAAEIADGWVLCTRNRKRK